ncbi:hypothetical protein HDU98_001366 [Podochytrium sp. JEL0797]|nr:hypothetical protein HDU98_001366 [Podochytrium sp. JEL0797]
MSDLTLPFLPTETLAQIILHLPFPTLLLLRLASRRFTHVIQGSDPLNRFKRFDTPTEYFKALRDVANRLLSRVFCVSRYLRSFESGVLSDWVLARILETRGKVFGERERSRVMDGVVLELVVRDREGKRVVGVAKVKLSAVENFGLEGGVRIHAKSSFLMFPVNAHKLTECFAFWDPGYVTLLDDHDNTRPFPADSAAQLFSPTISPSSSPPENRETRPLFPKSISRTGYFGDPGMRYLPCDANLIHYLNGIFDERLKIEFLADCSVGFCAEAGMEDSVSLDGGEFFTPPHDICIERSRMQDGMFVVCGLERGEFGTASLRGCVLPSSVFVVVYGAHAALDSPRLVATRDSFSPTIQREIDARRQVASESSFAVAANSSLNLTALFLEKLNNDSRNQVQQAWPKALRHIASTDPNQWTNVNLKQALIETLNLKDNDVAILIHNMLVSSHIFTLPTHLLRSTTSLLESLASGTDLLFTLNQKALKAVLHSLHPALLLPPTSPSPLLVVSKPNHLYWNSLKSHLKSHAPSDSLSVTYRIEPMGLDGLPIVTAQISVSSLVGTEAGSGAGAAAGAAVAPAGGLAFKSTPQVPWKKEESVDDKKEEGRIPLPSSPPPSRVLDFGLTPVADAREDAARLALAFLQRYHVDPASASVAVAVGSATTRLGAVKEDMGSTIGTPDRTFTPPTVTTPNPLLTNTSIYLPTLATWCQHHHINPPVYETTTLASNLGFSATVTIPPHGSFHSPFCADKKLTAKELAAQSACLALGIQIPASSPHSNLPSGTSSPAPGNTSDMALLNTFKQKHGCDVKVEYPVAGGGVRRMGCRITVEGFGVWESEVRFRFKWEAKMEAAGRVVEGLGLRKGSGVGGVGGSMPSTPKGCDARVDGVGMEVLKLGGSVRSSPAVGPRVVVGKLEGTPSGAVGLPQPPVPHAVSSSSLVVPPKTKLQAPNKRTTHSLPSRPGGLVPPPPTRTPSSQTNVSVKRKHSVMVEVPPGCEDTARGGEGGAPPAPPPRGSGAAGWSNFTSTHPFPPRPPRESMMTQMYPPAFVASPAYPMYPGMNGDAGMMAAMQQQQMQWAMMQQQQQWGGGMQPWSRGGGVREERGGGGEEWGGEEGE